MEYITCLYLMKPLCAIIHFGDRPEKYSIVVCQNDICWMVPVSQSERMVNNNCTQLLKMLLYSGVCTTS